MKLDNTILWGNVAGTAGNQIYRSGGSMTLRYCDYNDGATEIFGSIAASDCITTVPGFNNIGTVGKSGGGDFRLSVVSSCLNKGNATYNNTSEDLDGLARQNGLIDIGAFERQ